MRREHVPLAWGLLVGVALVVVSVLLWRAPRVDPLPAPLALAVDRHRWEREALNAQVTAAWREARAAQARRDTAITEATRLRSSADRAGRRADALAARAAIATTATDSAEHYRAAYEARTAERDTLLVVIDSLRSGVTLAEAEAGVLGTALVATEAHGQRADSLIEAVVAVTTKADCTVPGTFGRVRCPTRTQALVAGAVLAAVARPTYRAIKDGRLGVRLPLP